MKGKRILLVMAALALVLPLLGCAADNKVEQGRVISLEKDAEGKVTTVTLIHDSAMDSQNPVYDQLPPVKFKMPVDPQETGPEARAGQRMKLDVDTQGKEEIVIYDFNTEKLVHISIQIIDLQKSIDSNHALVKDKQFPEIDLNKKTVTIYSPRQKMLCTFSPPDQYLDQNLYPPSTWQAGDEVRLTYRESTDPEVRYQSLRFMNISRTDIYKR